MKRWNIMRNVGGPSEKLSFPSLDISGVNATVSVKRKLGNDGVVFVHGTNLKGLIGIAKDGAILSANDMIDKGITPKSGERGYTQHASEGADIKNGVSLYRPDKYYQAVHYTRGDTAIIIGVDRDTKMVDPVVQHTLGHPISSGSISHREIAKIYVPEGTKNAVMDKIAGRDFSSLVMGKVEEYNEVFNK